MLDKHPILFLESEIPKEWLECYPKPHTKRTETVYANSYPNKNFSVYYREEDALENTKHVQGTTKKQR